MCCMTVHEGTDEFDYRVFSYYSQTGLYTFKEDFVFDRGFSMIG